VRSTEIEQPSIAHQEQDEYAPDEVMNVAAAHHDPLKRPMLVHDQADQKPHTDERNQERNRCNKHASAGAIGNCGADEKAQAG